MRKISYELMYNLLTQIEVYLNSRPLSPLFNDSAELLPFDSIPFLIGDSLRALLQLILNKEGENRLWRYE